MSVAVVDVCVCVCFARVVFFSPLFVSRTCARAYTWMYVNDRARDQWAFQSNTCLNNYKENVAIVRVNAMSYNNNDTKRIEWLNGATYYVKVKCFLFFSCCVYSHSDMLGNLIGSEHQYAKMRADVIQFFDFLSRRDHCDSAKIVTWLLPRHFDVSVSDGLRTLHFLLRFSALGAVFLAEPNGSIVHLPIAMESLILY